MKLVGTADVFSENFKSGTMAKLGLDHASLSKLNPALIHVSHKGFLPGPYEHRTALDEVVQMMGGLAYMTGPEGRPLRAGASVNDIMGGMFGAIGALAALQQRQRTGRGQEVQSALFENNVFLVAQHMMQFAVTGQAAAPMPSRISAWGVYDVFTVKDDEQIFLAVVSDTQWALFCDAFGFDELRADDRLQTNNQRVRSREWLMPMLRTRLAGQCADDIAKTFETHGLPHARITRPHDLFDDPHLIATGGLAPIRIAAGSCGVDHDIDTRVPLLPLTLAGQRLPVRHAAPTVGEHTNLLLGELGYSPQEITSLHDAGVIAAASNAAQAAGIEPDNA
jgi:crotonobetainyl-CoA:carnitine CoA-transferase CaiB-like acyl-CoA transferase